MEPKTPKSRSLVDLGGPGREAVDAVDQRVETGDSRGPGGAPATP
jgi:hypothetical protein